MPDLPLWQLALVGIVALLGSMLSAVSGFGSAAVLLPVLAFALGEREAVPVLTIAQIVGNASKCWFNRGNIRWSAARWYLLGAMPAAVLGSLAFVAAPARLLSGLMGGFLLLAVAWRHATKRKADHARAARAPMSDRRLSIVGLFTGALSALVGARARSPGLSSSRPVWSRERTSEPRRWRRWACTPRSLRHTAAPASSGHARFGWGSPSRPS